MSWIMTNSGRHFDFAQPDPSQIDIWDIALGLSRLPRFGGQTRVAYSVAQHSVLVADIVPGEFALEALLHDAAEAYCQDLSIPLKNLLPDYCAMEANVLAVIMQRFGVRSSIRSRLAVWKADTAVLVTEIRDLMPGDFGDYLQGVVPIEQTIVAMSETESRAAFLQRFEAYGGRA